MVAAMGVVAKVKVARVAVMVTVVAAVMAGLTVELMEETTPTHRGSSATRSLARPPPTRTPPMGWLASHRLVASPPREHVSRGLQQKTVQHHDPSVSVPQLQTHRVGANRVERRQHAQRGVVKEGTVASAQAQTGKLHQHNHEAGRCSALVERRW